jgi:hypothetical protein
MENRIIRIENGIVSVPQSDEIRMTAFEIAALFEGYTQTVNANIKAVLKAGIIEVDISGTATVSENAVLPDVYGLEMIIALSFRIQSRNAEIFRNWLLGKASKPELPQILIMPVQNTAWN